MQRERLFGACPPAPVPLTSAPLPGTADINQPPDSSQASLTVRLKETLQNQEASKNPPTRKQPPDTTVQHEQIIPSIYPDSNNANEDLATIILEQKEKMLELLEEMRKRDGGKCGQPLTKKAYEKAANAIVESMDSFAKVVGKAEEKFPRIKCRN